SKLDTRDKYAMFLHGNNAFSRIEGRGEGKILVIKDSYANCFVPFLTEDYAQVDVIDLRSFKASVDRVMEENVYDNVLILYNFQSYHEDQNIVKLNFYNKA
ncbi:MAG: DHHW family protein, partial [Pygmaiobacter sp.]